MDIEVRRCLTALTSINYTSPIGLDCTSFTNKLLLQDQSVGNKKFQQNFFTANTKEISYFDIKMILSIENNH